MSDTQVKEPEVAKTSKSKRPSVQYVCGGRTMPEGQNKLSSVAYQYTAGVKAGERRISSAELAKLLKRLGVSDPKQPGWSVELPNGVKVECKQAGARPVLATPRKARAKSPAAAKKQTAGIVAAVLESAKSGPNKQATKAAATKKVASIKAARARKARAAKRAAAPAKAAKAQAAKRA